LVVGVGTHLLFVGFQTCIAEDLEALPVETAGTLATTGATEQRAAILTELVELKLCRSVR
jgi:hypothetical protein